MTEFSHLPQKVTADRQMALLVYILYCVGFLFPPTALVGVILAYANRDQAEIVSRSHFDVQIKLFLWGLVWGILANALFFLGGVGLIVLLGWVAWLIFNLVKGLSSLNRGEPFGAEPTHRPPPARKRGF